MARAASKKPFLRKENSDKGWVMPHYIWRKLRERFNSEYLQTSVKHTISPVVVLGSASGGGGNVIKIDEKMNTGSSEKYHQTTTLPMQYRKFLKRKTHTQWNNISHGMASPKSRSQVWLCGVILTENEMKCIQHSTWALIVLQEVRRINPEDYLERLQESSDKKV